MALNAQQLEILDQFFKCLDDTQKREVIARWNADIPKDQQISVSTVEEFLRAKKSVPKCPHCGSIHLVKNGHKNDRQRFICKDCKKTSTLSKNSILFSTKKDMSTWNMYIGCMVQKFALRKCAKQCSISLPSAFVWRHKILDALTNMMNAVKLYGISECDETYQLISSKGNHKKSKNFVMPRKARRHGGVASKRGISKEQVCITSGVDLAGHSIGRISNLGRPTHQELSSVLGEKIEHGAVLVTDSHKGYCKLAGDMELSHIRIRPNRHTSGSFNIQTVNAYHASLKKMINGTFMGVSTKYLNNYIVYHNLVNFARGSEEHKEAVMLGFVFTTACKSLWKKNPTRPAIPCVA